MKQICIVICLFLLTAFGANAQSKRSLEVISYSGTKSIFIGEGASVQVIKNGHKYNGYLKILSDQLIIINSDTILISQVQGIRARTSSSQLNGIALVVPGTIIGGLGVAGAVAGAIEGGYALVAAIFVVPVAAIGIVGTIKGIQLLSNGKKFPSSKWKYKIAIPSN